MTNSLNLISDSEIENSIFDSFIAVHASGFTNASISVSSKRVFREGNDSYEVVISGSPEQWNAHIEHNSDAAFRAALNHLRKLSFKGLKVGKYSHAASFAIRGVIEGFYGKPWSHQQRKKELPTLQI